MSASGKSKNRMYDERRRAIYAGTRAVPSAKEATMADMGPWGERGDEMEPFRLYGREYVAQPLPGVSFEEFSRGFDQLILDMTAAVPSGMGTTQDGSNTYYTTDRATRVNAGGHPVDQKAMQPKVEPARDYTGPWGVYREEQGFVVARLMAEDCGCIDCSQDRLAGRRPGHRVEPGRDYTPKSTPQPGGKYYAPHQPSPDCDCLTCSPGLHEKRTTSAEREATAEQLADQFVAGTLDAEEYHDRMDTAMAAKFPSILRSLTADLPTLPKPEPKPDTWRPHNERITGAFRRERPSYRIWTSQQWAGQNAAAAAITLGAIAMTGASGNGALDMGAVLISCTVTCLLGLRKSRELGLIGFVLGGFFGLGTILMIMLTWRSKPAKDRPGQPGSRGW